MKAIRRNLRIAPKKVNLVADMVRGKMVATALEFLKFAPKKSAKPLMEAVRSAAANAQQNFKQELNTLYINTIVVTEGPRLKRQRPVSRGRSHPIIKRTSHITVELGVQAAEKGKAPASASVAAPKQSTKGPK